MKNYDIDKKYAVLSKRDSLGSQTKFYKDGYWYKYDTLGKEGLAEELTSVVLSCSSISDYVAYERCKINGRDGCRSRSFLGRDEQILTYEQVYRNITGHLLSNDLFCYYTASERLNYIIEFMKEAAGLDVTKQLYENIAMDFITQNPDRQFKNLAFILGRDGKIRSAPLFDNGQGLRQNYAVTPPYLTHEECEEKLSAATISGSFSEAFSVISSVYSGEKLKIDFQKLDEALEGYGPSLARDFLKYRIACCKQYDGLITDSAVKIRDQNQPDCRMWQDSDMDEER